MTTEEDVRRTLLIEAQIELYRRQARWEPWKALAAIIAAAAVLTWMVGWLLLRVAPVGAV
jgi:hypothetical protein